MQPDVREHVSLQGIQTDDERSTVATASCPLSYEEQCPANWPDMRRTSTT